MQFYNKTSFRDARQDAHYVFLFFLESRNQENAQDTTKNFLCHVA
jgi:hypothetical protein